MSQPTSEVQAIKERYSRRPERPDEGRYDPLDSYMTMVRQERERTVIRCIRWAGLAPVSDKQILEIGCGNGSNLIDLIRLGFKPHNIVGNELLDDRLSQARARLPLSVTLLSGDASQLELDGRCFDIVLQSTVFTSILDEPFQQRLAIRLWSLVKPGGGILWYDFIWNSPGNPDVRRVPLKRFHQLFPWGSWRRWSVTLAPPIGRCLCRVAPGLYPVANALPFLRTHVLCWIGKPS